MWGWINYTKRYESPLELEKFGFFQSLQNTLTITQFPFKKHTQVWHCSACGQQGQSNVTSHIASVHMRSASPYRCQCGQSFVWSNDLYRHVRENHIGTRYSCNICGSIFNTETSVLHHIQEHQRNGEINWSKKKKSTTFRLLTAISSVVIRGFSSNRSFLTFGNVRKDYISKTYKNILLTDAPSILVPVVFIKVKFSSNSKSFKSPNSQLYEVVCQ